MPDLADTAYENISDSNFESAMNSDTSENEDVSNDEGKGQQRNTELNEPVAAPEKDNVGYKVLIEDITVIEEPEASDLPSESNENSQTQVNELNTENTEVGIENSENAPESTLPESVELSQHVDSPLEACMTSKSSECSGTKVVTRSSVTRLPKD